MNISYSAPISVPLSGLPTGLYGKPILAMASTQRIIFSIKDATEKINDDLILTIEKAVVSNLKKRKSVFEIKPYSYSIVSDVKFSYDLGYKSALIVAAVASFLHFFTGKDSQPDMVNSIAYQIEKDYLHVSLGLYSSCSCFGGLIYFRKEFEFLKSISKLNFKLPKNIEDNLYLIDLGQTQESSLDMITYIKNKYNEHLNETEKIVNMLEKITKRFVVAVAKEDTAFFEKSIKEAHSELINLGLVHADVGSIIKDLKSPFSIAGFGMKKEVGGLAWGLVYDKKHFDKTVKKYDLSAYKLNLSDTGLLIT